VDRSSAVKIFTGIADDNDATEEDVLNAYVRANEAKRSHQAKLKVQIDAAMEAGMTRGQINQAFKNSGVSRKELNNILNNRYDPIKVSRALIREVNDEVNVKKENRILKRVPVQSINEIRRTLQNTEILSTQSQPTEEYTLPEPIGYVLPEPLGSVNSSQPTESFIAPVTEAVSGAVDTVSNIGEGLLNRARTFAPGLLGDPKNQAIVDRAQDNQ